MQSSVNDDLSGLFDAAPAYSAPAMLQQGAASPYLQQPPMFGAPQLLPMGGQMSPQAMSASHRVSQMGFQPHPHMVQQMNMGTVMSHQLYSAQQYSLPNQMNMGLVHQQPIRSAPAPPQVKVNKWGIFK